MEHRDRSRNVSDLVPVRGVELGLRARSIGWRTLIASLVVLASVVLGSIALAAGNAGQSRDPQTTIKEGIDLIYRATIAAPGAHGNEISDGALAEHAKAVPGLLSRYFSEPAFSNLTTALTGAITNQLGNGDRDTSGGAKVVEITSFSSTGDRAEATARALVWLRTENARAADRVIDTPPGWWDYKLQLARTSDGWRIVQFDATPERGTAP